MNSNYRKAEDAYLSENTEQEEAVTLKDEWMENWMECEKVTPEILWEAFNEQPIPEGMDAHMRVLAAIAYDERMT